MHVPRMRLALTLIACLSLLAVGLGGNISSPTGARAATYSMNPAPFNHWKASLSSAALMGLAMEKGLVKPQIVPGGGDNGTPPLVLATHPHSVPASGSTGAGTSGPSAASAAGLLDFNNDPTALPQNETTVTVRQEGTSGNATENQVVGGFNDARGFFFIPGVCGVTGPSRCYPELNCPDPSGFSVTLDGGQTVAKSGCLPFAQGTWQPWGDPALDRDTYGNVYYGSLTFDRSAKSDLEGIVLHRSTPALFGSSDCQNTAVAANPCWVGRVVFSAHQGTNPSTGKCDPGYCEFQDKDWVAVDRYSATQYRNDVYIAWNRFFGDGTSQMMLSRCTPAANPANGFTSCTAPLNVTKPGDQFTGGGSYLTVGRDGHVYVAYYNFGTPTTLYPIDGRVAVLTPGATSILGWINVAHLTQDGAAGTTPCLPNTDPPGSTYGASPCKDNTYPGALAGNDWRTPAFFKVDIDRSTGIHQNRLYTTFELCSVPQYYAEYSRTGDILYSGNCPKTDVIVTHQDVSFSGSGALVAGTLSWRDITPYVNSSGQQTLTSVPGQQFFPYVSVDDANGTVSVSYMSTQNDAFQNMNDAYVQQSTDGGATFVYPSNGLNVTQGRITQESYQATKDPLDYFDDGSCIPAGGGCFGFWPQNGDYIQGLAAFGHLFVHISGTYVDKGFESPPSCTSPGVGNPPGCVQFSEVDQALPMHQMDTFLANFDYTKAAGNTK